MSKTLIAFDDCFDVYVEPNLDVMVMHVQCKNPNLWGVKKRKEWKKHWEYIKDRLREQGINEVVSAVPKTDDKLLKFQLMWGMLPFLELEDCILFRQEI